MGTRHSILVIANGKTRVEQYGQWDGYPSGKGVDIVDFLRKHKKRLDEFKKKCISLKRITRKELKSLWVKAGANPKSELVNMSVVEKFQKKNPHLDRDCGAKVLQLIMDGVVKKVNITRNFVADGLFCEYAYVIDLDKNVLEVYKGFMQMPAPKRERFAYLNEKVRLTKSSGNYYPVHLMKKYNIKKLPTDDKQFINELMSIEKVMGAKSNAYVAKIKRQELKQKKTISV